MQKIRKSFWAKVMAVFLAINLMGTLFTPSQVFALTGGPSQPEVQSFMPMSVSDMVDLSSGDFHYNIPLLQVGDYPVNLLYNGGITTDQEASWVGLGWNINPGVINRQMKTLPDDFKGDKIKSKTSMKNNSTYGLSVSAPNIELGGFSFFNLNFSLGISYNNYTGVGFTQTIGIGVQLSNENSDNDGRLGLMSISAGLDGPLSIKPDLSLSRVAEKKAKREKGAQKKETAPDDGTAKKTKKEIRKAEMDQFRKKLDSQNAKTPNRGKANKALSMATYLMAGQGYTPTVKHPMKFTPLSLRLVLGGGAFLIDGQPLRLTGYYNKQSVKSETISSEAFGYNYLQFADKTSLLDYSRDNDVAYKRTIPYLPNPVIGYDSYIVNGQGIGGMFRPHRSDYGSLHDANNFNGSVGGSLGIEADIGNLIDLGFDVQVNAAQSFTRKWSDLNKMESVADFRYGKTGKIYEPFYFKFLGEMPFDEELADIKSDFLGERAAQVRISDAGTGQSVLSARVPDVIFPGSSTILSQDFTASSYPKRNERVKRESMISYLTASEVKKAGLTGWKNPYSKDHHIAEITVTKENGSRYVYGRPAYNIVQEEMQFNVSGEAHELSVGMTKYSTSAASLSNHNGIDEYFNSKTMPPYAHSYLITAVLSTDYVDADATKGPSVNDYGNYTLFNYFPSYSYNWRSPNKPSFDSGTDINDYNYANLSEGVTSKDDDDMGSVVNGKKEIHYVREIRSKHQVAVFTISSREDSKEARGGINTMKKLDRIDLYSLPDYEANYNEATPIKTVHFKYSYKLCPGIYNGTNGKGKLTLEKVYFTYGNSNISALNDYTFEYQDFDLSDVDEENPNANLCQPAYHPLSYDAWGNFKPHDAETNPGASFNSQFPYLNQDFSLSDQDTESPNKWAKAWSLKTINLPSGGSIEIELEADQYTHVQNKRAMQMVQVIGVSSASGDSPGVTLYSSDGPKRYIHFKIPQGQYASNSEFITKCVQPLINGQIPVYFNFSVDVLNNNQANDHVKGYFQLRSVGISSSDDGWVEVEPFEMEGGLMNGDAHPVSQAAWNYAKIHHPKKAYGFPEMTSGGNALDVMLTLATNSLIGSVIQTIAAGPDHRLRSANFGRICDPTNSWFRVFAAEKGKYGGGSRVSEIRIIDNWNAMTTEDGNSSNKQAAYGQKYEYTLDDGFTSSGIAAFEPEASQENPLIVPAFYRENRTLVPEESFYLEGPIGRSFYPAAKVTYSRVSVKSLYLEEVEPGSGEFSDVSAITHNHSNGYTISEFYTTKDFPTKSSATPKDVANQLLNSLVGSLFNFYTFNWETVSQGFYVETNDMDGKLKSQSEYSADGILMARTENVYHTKTGTDPGLDNTVLMVDNDLSVKCEEVGVELDFYHDFKENYSISETVGFQPNVGSFLLFVWPVVVPAFFPDISVHETRLRTAATMKVIHKHGLLKEVKTFNQGAEVITRNLAYDRESGEVLLSSATNEYNEEHFSFAFPAHWKYPRMGGAYQNEGYEVKGKIMAPSSNSNPTENALNSFFVYDNIPYSQDHDLVPGDEVLVTDLETFEVMKGWIYQPEGNPEIYIIDRDGISLNTDNTYPYYPRKISVKVIRSGNRNMQGMAMGSITTLHNPLGEDITPRTICEGTGTGQLNFAPGINDTKVLHAAASTYKEDWKTLISECEGFDCDSPMANGIEAYLSLTNMNLYEAWLPVLNGLLDHITVGTTDFTSANFPLGSLKGVIRIGGSVFNIENPEFLDLTGNNIWVLRIIYTENGNLQLTYSPDGSFSYLTNSSLNIHVIGEIENCTGLNAINSEYDEFLQVSCGDLGPYPESFFMFQFFPLQGIYIVRDIDGDIRYVRASWFHSYPEPPGIMTMQYSTFLPIIECDIDLWTPSNSESVNPYVRGLKGNWRMDTEWAYKGDREYLYDPATNLTNIREDGYYASDFSNFWQHQATGWTDQLASSGWVESRNISDHSPFGTEVENIDPLHRFSAAVFGYNHKLPVCMANNASYQQIGFDSFEDYGFYNGPNNCYRRHFAYEDYADNVSMEEAHTGYHSLKIPESELVSTTRTLEAAPLGEPDENMPYIMQPENDLGLFGPETYNINAAASGIGSIDLTAPPKYILSYWVREKLEGQLITTVDDFSAHTHEVIVNGVEVNYGSEKRSPIIDGWQRVEREFFIPPGASGDIEVKIVGSGTQGSPTGNGVSTYIDDIRVHPFNSSFKSFTYDYRTLRLMAELDENNFATFYEYDREGNLIRLKQETERGKMTLKEYRKDLPYTP